MPLMYKTSKATRRIHVTAWRGRQSKLRMLRSPNVGSIGMSPDPDTPQNTTAFYLSEWERNRARERIDEEGRTPVGKLDATVFNRVLLSWQFYIFFSRIRLLVSHLRVICDAVLRHLAQVSENILSTSNQQHSHSMGAINFTFMVGTGYVSDKLGRRGPVCFVVRCLLAVCYTIFTTWSESSVHYHEMLWMLYILLAGWVKASYGGDQQLRAFVLAFTVSLGSAVFITFQQLQFPSGQTLTFTKTHGWVSGLCFVLVLTLWTGFGIDLVERVFTRKRKESLPKETDV